MKGLMRIRNSLSVLLMVLLAVLFLYACGGGGGGGDDQIIPNDDYTAPLITLVAPIDNATDVQNDILIKVSFNEVMNSSTVNATSFIVKDALGFIVPGVITESNTIYIFTPDSDLAYDTIYTVTITTDVTDLANNNLENSYLWSFSTLSLPGATSPLTLNVSTLTDTSVTLNAAFTNPLNYTTTAWFEYGLTDSYGSTTPPVVYAAAATIGHSADLNNLPEKTTYHYRIVTENNDGFFYGDDKTFRTYISPVTLADNLDAPGSLHLHNNELYWIEIYGNSIRKVSVNGGLITTEASTAIGGNNASLEMDMTHLYWGDDDDIWMKPIGTGITSLIASSLPDLGEIKVFSSDLYSRSRGSGGIKKIAIADGSYSTVVPNQTYSISSDAIDASGIYWTHIGDGTISKSAHDGSSMVTIAVGLSFPSSLILEAGKLYWAESGAIKSMSTSGGQITTIAINVSPISNIVKDSTHIYFVDSTFLDGAESAYFMTSVNIITGEVSILTQVDNQSGSVVVDSTSVYWLKGGNHYYPPMGQLRTCAKSY